MTDGRREKVAFDKITARIAKLCYNLDTNYVDCTEVAQKVLYFILFPTLGRLWDLPRRHDC